MQIDIPSMKQAVQDVSKLLEDGKKHAENEYRFQSFKAKNEPFRLAAIDGSNHNIRGMNFLFTTIRSGYQIYENGHLSQEKIDPITVEFIANADDLHVGYLHKYEKYYQHIVETLPEKYPEFEKTPERIRTLLEWGKLVELIDLLGRDDIIVFDGALISGTITTNYAFFHSLQEKARKKGIALIGLSKDTSLSLDAVPVPLVLLESSKKQQHHQNWYVEYQQGTYFVRFSSLVEQVFRMDVVLPDHLTVEQVISRLSDYCFDEAVTGYPFPMQTVHDAVRIAQDQKEECYYLFKEACIEGGIDEHYLEKMFEIYHDRLDVISFGR